MNERQQKLLDELNDMQIAPQGVELSFEARLARENGWDLAQAIEVNREYRRFLFLMLEAGHPVTPSDQVDQAWHLHLIYTRSYWDDLCGRIAGRSLHHGPTQGGKSEADKFVDWYARTKRSYREFFGDVLPVHVWPDAKIRFGEDVRFQRINLARSAVIPRPGYWLRRLISAFFYRTPKRNSATAPVPTTAHSLAFIPLLGGMVNPFDLNARDFLTLYFLIMVVVIVVAVVLRQMLRNRETFDSLSLKKSAGKLSVSEVAFLSQGPKGPVDAAIAELSQQGILETDKSHKKLVSNNKVSTKLSILQQTIVSACGSGRGASLMQVRQACGSEVVKVSHKLKDDGLMESFDSFLWPRAASALVMLAVLVFGVGRVFIGLERGKPVGYLIALILLGVVALILSLQKPRLTVKGMQLLEFLKQNMKPNSSIQSESNMDKAGLASTDLAMSVALLGIAAVGTNSLDGSIAKLLKHDRTRASCDGGVYTGCGGGGDGGGGDAGGGGGGGGCGGCGGGGS